MALENKALSQEITLNLTVVTPWPMVSHCPFSRQDPAWTLFCLYTYTHWQFKKKNQAWGGGIYKKKLSTV